MRNVQKIPRPFRRASKAVMPPETRARLHDLDYHVGLIIATYQHHLNLAPPSLPARVRAFEEAFGYKLSVDPEVYEGPILRKSEKRAPACSRVLYAASSIRGTRVFPTYPASTPRSRGDDMSATTFARGTIRHSFMSSLTSANFKSISL